MKNTVSSFAIVLLAACGGSGSSESPIDKTQLTGADGKADTDAVQKVCRELGQPASCDICDIEGWYGDGECDLFCELADDDCFEGDDSCTDEACGWHPLGARLCPDGQTVVAYTHCGRNESGVCEWTTEDCPTENDEECRGADPANPMPPLEGECAFSALCRYGDTLCHCAPECAGTQLPGEAPRNVYVCEQRAVACPETAPVDGDGCVDEGIICDYDVCAVTHAVCTNGLWDVTLQPPPA